LYRQINCSGRGQRTQVGTELTRILRNGGNLKLQGTCAASGARPRPRLGLGLGFAKIPRRLAFRTTASETAPVSLRSGQVRFVTRPKSRTMRAKGNNARELTGRLGMCPNEQRARECRGQSYGGDGAMVVNLELLEPGPMPVVPLGSALDMYSMSAIPVDRGPGRRPGGLALSRPGSGPRRPRAPAGPGGLRAGPRPHPGRRPGKHRKL
jgi:hypothetical protein